MKPTYGPLVAGVALVAAAWSLVWTPLLGDQALMAIIGHDVVRGRHLYTEIFDAKQPGMYLWYGVAHAMTVPAVGQALCVLVVVATSVLLVRLIWPDLSTAQIKTWAPVLVAAPLLLCLSPYDLGQTELLMCLPATAAVLLVARGDSSRNGLVRAGCAGLCLGVIAVFKSLLVAVPGVAVLLLVLLSGRSRWRRLAAVVAGSVVAPCAVVVWLAVRGDLGAAVDAWFVYPGQVLRGASTRDTGRLVAAVTRFVILMAPVLVLAAWRIPIVLRRRKPFELALLAWLLAGVASYAVQVWWSYYLLIVLPPLIGLAVLQLDDLVQRPLKVRRAALVVLALLALPLALYGVRSTALTVADGGGVTEASRARIADRIGDYGSITREIAAVAPAPDDSVFVLGDPRYQLAADRPIPISTNGWSAAVIPPQRWEMMAAELRAVRPDLIMVGPESAVALAERGGAVRTVLDELYTETRRSDAGVWFRLDRDTTPP